MCEDWRDALGWGGGGLWWAGGWARDGGLTAGRAGTAPGCADCGDPGRARLVAQEIWYGATQRPSR